VELTIDFGLGLLVERDRSLINNWVSYPVIVRALVSWIALLILVYAMTAPSTPRKTLVAARRRVDGSRITIAHFRGLNVPTVMESASIFMGNYMAALACR
jgi:hypothetical protein